ncbi:MAG: hypothetical protein AAFQ40_01565 [Cyanobacteria bacterium J06623_5]
MVAGNYMRVHEIAITIGAIGTTVSSIVATRTYIATTERRINADKVATADAIRRDLQRAANSASSLVVAMVQGTPLLTAASLIATEVEQCIPTNATSDEIESILQNKQLMVSACVNGWEKAAASKEVSNAILNLGIETAKFTGGYRLIGESAELFQAIVNDGYSPAIFINIIDARSQVKSIGDAIPLDKGIQNLKNALTVELQSNSATYFVARYEKAIREIDKFVNYLVRLLVVMPDENLLQIQKMRSEAGDWAGTRTSTLRHMLRELETFFDPSEMPRLITMVENIESFIGKEHASAEARRLTKLQ